MFNLINQILSIFVGVVVGGVVLVMVLGFILKRGGKDKDNAS